MRQRAGFWVLIALVALLCFLGFLQYRWIDRLASAEQERARQALRAAILDLSSALDVEVTRAQIAFAGMPTDSDQSAFWANRHQIWNEFAPYPRIVKDVFITVQGQNFRLGPGSAQPVDGDLEDGDNPVAVMPMRSPPGVPPGMRTIVFDSGYIRTELLPRLASRHVNPDRYGFRIASGEQVIFETADFEPEFDTRLFAFRPECFAGAVGRRSGGPPPFERRGGGPPRSAWPRLGGFRGDFQIGAALVARTDITCPDPNPNAPEPGRWTVQAGFTVSSTAGLHEFRTRSLLLSFGVLAVLATGIGMLGLYAHRSQILAQSQMEFAMAVSHELRTPLTVIRVAADNLVDGLVSDPRRYGEMIKRETIRLTDMVEQVLVFARTQRSGIEPRFETVAPADVIDRALDAVSSSMQSAGLRVERKVDEGLPSIRADANLVSAGLQNLLMNSAKYAGAGALVRVRAARAPESAVSIIVEDSGPGVRPSELERIFSPFYRSADAVNSRVPGLGLGLHLVKRIVEAHGGTVTAVNRADRGLLVEVRIPSVG